MKIFYWVLISTYLVALISRFRRYDDIKKMNIFYTIIILVILVVVAGSRTAFIDTGAYFHLYNIIDDVKIINDSYEPGFILYFKLLHQISDDPQFMIFITSLITIGLIIFTLRKYSKNTYKELIIYMFVAGGTYIGTMNGMRQYLAAALIFAFTPLIEKRKFKLYLFVCILCMMIHSSAFIMIPIYFLVNHEAWSKKTLILIIVSIIGIIFFNPIINILFNLIGGKFGDYKNFNEGGASPLRVLVISVPLILSYIKRNEFKDKNFNKNLFINMSLLNLLIMIVSLYNWIFARFGIYLGFYNLILLPYTLKNLFSKKERRVIYYLFLVFYLIFFWYEGIVVGINYVGLLNI